MLVRPASMLDLSAVCAWAKGKHAESNWSAIAFNAVWFRRVLKASIADPEHCVFLALQDGKVRGLLIGCHMPLLFSPLRCATDMVFVADAGGDHLMRAFLRWCKARRVVRIDMGNSQNDDQRIDRFMERKGFARAGRMYYWNAEAEHA